MAAIAHETGKPMEQKMIAIRNEQRGDEEQIYEVNLRAFERNEEADIVNVLRDAYPERVSLVAELDRRIVGHVLFTPARIEDGESQLVGATLAPLAVLPEYQKTGIGSALVQAGLEAMRRAGEPFVVLVGHPTYYPRFGFERASRYRLVCEYSQAPDDAFMILVLDPRRMQGVKGTVRFPPEFAPGVPETPPV